MTAKQEPVQSSWLVQEVVGKRREIFGEDADWYRVRAFEAAQQVVRNAVRKDRTVLEGFEQLQAAYSIEREGEPHVVPFELMSNAEFAAKAGELKRMGRGCFDHAAEIDRYVEKRKGEKS